MKYTLPPVWRRPAAALAAAVLAAGPILAHGQSAATPHKAQSAPLTLLLSGPTGEHSSLVYSANSGWRMQRGWNVKADVAESRLTTVALPVAPEPPTEASALARPLTVFLDGPTGFTFVYVAGEGWKFVGQIANPGR